MSKFKVGHLQDFAPNTAHRVDVDGEDVVIIRNDDVVYALEDRCSHAEVALSDGDVNGCEIECYLHGAKFDVRTGKALCMPATEDTPSHTVKIDAGKIYVALNN